MARWSGFAAGAVVVVGAALVTGASVPRPADGPLARERAAAGLGPKTMYFNTAQVMREYKRAITLVAKLNGQRTELSVDLVAYRAMLADLQETQKVGKDARPVDDTRVAWIAADITAIQRLVEDADRDITKTLNDRASAIIAELYDEIQAVVAEVARERGLVAVLAYPDAVTPEEKDNAYLKELKLKPPAAQPFYLDPSVDCSGEIVRRLNARYAAEKPGQD